MDLLNKPSSSLFDSLILFLAQRSACLLVLLGSTLDCYLLPLVEALPFYSKRRP